MKKLEFQDERDKYKNLKLTFHDALIAKQVFHYIESTLKKYVTYLLIANIYFACRQLTLIYKQCEGTIWRGFINGYIKYWLLIYLIPLFAFGIVLPAALVSVIYVPAFKIWLSWIIIGCLFIILISPYSIVLMNYYFKKNLTKKYHNQLQKVKIQ